VAVVVVFKQLVAVQVDFDQLLQQQAAAVY
jgi:hypothetical protein